MAHRITSGLLAAASLLALTALVPAAAQPVTAPNPDETATDDNESAEVSDAAPAEAEEVLVTAQRRQTRLQDVPFSIMAFGGEELARQQINDSNLIAQRVPGASFTGTTDKGNAVMGMRGVRGVIDAPAAELPVVFFIDDVYTSGVSGLGGSFYDVDRIEVLRGPQGTLFGRNVTGGAFSISNKKPVYERDYGGSVTLGNFNQLGIEGFYNDVLIEDKLAARFSFMHNENSGLYGNRAQRTRSQMENVTAVRGQFLYEPNDNLSLHLGMDYSFDHGTSNPAKLYCYTPAGAFCHPSLVPPLSPDSFTVDQNASQAYQQRIYGGFFRIDYDWADVGTITSITAYRRNINFSDRDPDAIPLDVFTIGSENNDRQFTQEIRIASPGEDQFSYVAGMFYLWQHNNRRNWFNEQGIPGTTLFGTTPVRRLFSYRQDATNTSFAVFAEVNWKVTPELSIAVGGRYTVDDKDGVTTVQGFNPARFRDPTPAVVPYGPKQWNAFTPRIYIKYEMDPDVTFYGTVSKGYKGGGFAFNTNTSAGLRAPFEPEEVINYEVGVKSRLFDRRLQFNMSLFHQDVTNLQVTFFDNGLSFLRNVGSARQRGVEIESNLRITDEFSMFANYAYLDAKYIEYFTGTANYSGNRMPVAPKHALTVGGRYTTMVTDDLELSLSADYTYRSKILLSDANNVVAGVVDQSDWNLWNASIDLASIEGNWRLSLWGKNLTNDDTIQGAFNQNTIWLSPSERAAGWQAYQVFLFNPRTVGLTLSVNY